MNILALIKALLEKGKATKSEMADLKKAYETLGTETKTVVDTEYQKAIKLTVEDEEEGGSDEKSVKDQLMKLMSGVKDEVAQEAKTLINEFIKEQKELIKKEVGVYHKDVKPSRDKINEKFKSFASAIINQTYDAPILKEMTTSESSPSAGFTIDSELSAEIRHLQTEYGVSRREFTSLQLQKGDLKANALATDITVNWEGETDVIASSQVVLGQETLTLAKLAVIVTQTNELLEDQEVDLFGFIASRVAENFAKKEDEAFFKGDGSGTFGSFTGLLINTDVNEVTIAGTTFASMDADDLIDMKDATPQGALANAKYYMHRTIRSIVRKLKATDGTYIYQAPSQSGPATIWGDPVVLVEAMPSISDTAADTSFVLYGDLKKACILGFKGAIRAKRFDAGVVRNVAGNADINLITTDREAIRWTQRVGYIIILPTAVTKLTTAAAS